MRHLYQLNLSSYCYEFNVNFNVYSILFSTRKWCALIFIQIFFDKKSKFLNKWWLVILIKFNIYICYPDMSSWTLDRSYSHFKLWDELEVMLYLPVFCLNSVWASTCLGYWSRLAPELLQLFYHLQFHCQMILMSITGVSCPYRYFWIL